MGDGNFRPPTESTPLDRSSKKIWYTWLRRRPLRLRQIWCKSADGGLLGKWVKYNPIFLFIVFFHELTYRVQVRFSRLMAQTKRTRARMCLLGVSLTLRPILGVKSPENPNFWGVNKRFQAKRTKYWTFHVIETTGSISTKFCTTIETIKNSSWVVAIGVQIQDGGRPPFWKKPLNRYVSATVWPILIRFGTVTHIGLLQRIDR